MRIGTVFGIPVKLHWTFLVLAWVFLFTVDDLLVGVVTFLTLFGSVFLHELGHSLVAMGFGIRVIDITFWPLGGMARMSTMPEEPKVEGLIAIAGPLVNLALAALALPFFLAYELPTSTAELDLMRAQTPLGAILGYFVFMNVAMAVLNLVPAFPMDGGRILRSLFALRASWLRATERAVAVGRFFALGFVLGPFVLAPLFGGNLCMLPLIGLFVWWAGAQELFATRLRHAPQVSPFVQAGRGFGWQPGGPVEVTPGGDPGDEPGDEPGPEGGARRPRQWSPLDPRGAGFDDEVLRRLERFQGRLRRPPEE